jgi:hypothetical protein
MLGRILGDADDAVLDDVDETKEQRHLNARMGEGDDNRLVQRYDTETG